MAMTVEVPELPELTFDEASHIYRLNGRRHPERFKADGAAERPVLRRHQQADAGERRQQRLLGA